MNKKQLDFLKNEGFEQRKHSKVYVKCLNFAPNYTYLKLVPLFENKLIVDKFGVMKFRNSFNSTNILNIRNVFSRRINANDSRFLIDSYIDLLRYIKRTLDFWDTVSKQGGK